MVTAAPYAGKVFVEVPNEMDYLCWYPICSDDAPLAVPVYAGEGRLNINKIDV